MKKTYYKTYINDLKLALDKELILPQIRDESSYKIEFPKNIIDYLLFSKSPHPIVALDRTCVLVNRIERRCRKHMLYDNLGPAIVFHSRRLLKDLVTLITSEIKGKDNIDYRTKRMNRAIREQLPVVLYYLDGQIPCAANDRVFIVEYELSKADADKLMELVRKELGFKPDDVYASTIV